MLLSKLIHYVSASNRTTATLAKGATVVAVVAVAHQAADVSWRLLDSKPLVMPKAQVRADGPSSASNARFVPDIASLSLLGTAQDEPQSIQQQIDTPETRLSLSLRGILATDTGESSVIIAQQGGDGEYFKVGDLVFGRVRLVAIYSDYVILDNGGKREKLNFEEDSTGLIQKSALPTRADSGAKSTFDSKLNVIATPEELVDFARSELMENPRQALNNLGVEPSDQGYRVTNRAGMLLSLGMQPGDIILSINGQSLGNIEQDRGLIDQVYTTGQARIEVQRGNRRYVINHSFR